MGILEIIGVAAIWIVATWLLIMLTMWLMGTYIKGGLEVMVLMSYAAIGICGLSVVAGIFMLGRLFA
jgi:hypothetical protein